MPTATPELRPDADVLVLRDDSWWPGRVTRVRGAKVRVDVNVMGTVVSEDHAAADVAIRLDPARHGPPPEGARVLAAESYAAFAGQEVDNPAIVAMLGWRRGRVVAVRDDRVDVAFDPEGDHDRSAADDDDADERNWLPLAAIAAIADAPAPVRPPAKDRQERVRGVIRRAAGPGPVLVAATIAQGDAPVRPRRTHAEPFQVERADGTRVLVAPGAAFPQVSPTIRERGDWDELRAHPLAAVFADFAPGPHETFELRGEALVDGDTVELVGERLQAGDDLVVEPRRIAAGRKAAAEIDAFLGEGPAKPPAAPRDDAPGWRRRLAGTGHCVALVLALPGVYAWLVGGFATPQIGALLTSLLLAMAVYHHRVARPLTRFRRREPSRTPPFAIAGARERGRETGLVGLWIALLFAGGVLVAVVAIDPADPDLGWLALAGAALWSLVLAGMLLWHEGPQLRVLAILARAARHAGPGAWGVTTGTVADGRLTRRIDIHHWSTSRTVTETVKTANGGTTQVQKQVTDHHSAGGRTESLPGAITVTTAAGPLAVRGCNQATWGTATPRLVDVPGEGTVGERIEEAIGPGDAVAIFGRLAADASIAHTGPGSLIVFGAPAGRDAHAAARARLAAHLVGLALILAAVAPTLIAALRGPAAPVPPASPSAAP